MTDDIEQKLAALEAKINAALDEFLARMDWLARSTGQRMRVSGGIK